MNQGFVTIRVATEEDIPLGYQIVKDLYPSRQIERSEGWIRWAIKHPDRLVLIGLHSVGVAEFSWKYGFEPRARLGMLATRPEAFAILEPLRMVRMMLTWAVNKGARGSFLLDADTGVDFGAFARRLGGKEVVLKRWEIPLHNEGADHG